MKLLPEQEGAEADQKKKKVLNLDEGNCQNKKAVEEMATGICISHTWETVNRTFRKKIRERAHTHTQKH